MSGSALAAVMTGIIRFMNKTASASEKLFIKTTNTIKASSGRGGGKPPRAKVADSGDR